MIPVKLELHNFLAYSDPEPIDFAGLHVACLVGANGAGKSSLLDAMTWVLWGKARAPHDDLIRLGESEMEVRLTFSFGQNMYRVQRWRSKEGRGSSQLNLEVYDGERFHSISESTLRATQRKINSILRLDYDTFINSAFLAQGRADEFTSSMTPAARKALLGEILNLSVWTTYEDRAKQQIKAIEGQLRGIDAEVANIDAELAREIDYRRDLNDKERHLREISEALDELEARQRELEADRRERERQRAEVQAAQHTIEETTAELERLQEQHQKRQNQRIDLEAVLADEEVILEGYNALQTARQREKELSASLMTHGSLREEMATLTQTIQAARSQIEADVRAQEQHITALSDQLMTDEDRDAFKDVKAEIETLEEYMVEVDGLRERLVDMRGQQAEFVVQRDTLRGRIDELAAQRDTLEGTNDPLCPTCGQELTDEHRRTLLEALYTEGRETQEQYKAQKAHIAGLKAEIEQVEYEIKDSEPKLRRLDPLRDRRARFQQQVEDAQRASDALTAAREKLAELQTTLDGQQYALEAQVHLQDCEAQLAQLGYDENAYHAVRDTLEAYSEYERLYVDLQSASERLAEVDGELAELDARIVHVTQRHTEALKTHQRLAESLAVLDERLADYDDLDRQIAKLREDQGIARSAVGAAEQRVLMLDKSRDRRAELLSQQEMLAAEKAIYSELKMAFGRDGVPAMVIETAIPEIEQEANQLLARMTDGRMHIRFDTQREKKTGGAMETLDIRIADELGTRDYSTFSGGESFRVNFAIRLALSRMLARRAGAQLRTLIIDEGFGTQDAQGRERLVQAINAVQDEFDLLLVITHIEELKDAFPARIEVTKMPSGSVIEIA